MHCVLVTSNAIVVVVAVAGVANNIGIRRLIIWPHYIGISITTMAATTTATTTTKTVTAIIHWVLFDTWSWKHMASLPGSAGVNHISVQRCGFGTDYCQMQCSSSHSIVMYVDGNNCVTCLSTPPVCRSIRPSVCLSLGQLCYNMFRPQL